MTISFISDNTQEFENIFNSTSCKKINENFKVLGYFNQSQLTENQIGILNKTDIIISTWNMVKLSVDDIHKYFPRVKALFYAGGDTSYFNQPYEKLGIKVFDAKEVNSSFVSNYIYGLILLQTKSFLNAQKKYKMPLYIFSYKNAHKQVKSSGGNYRKTIGLIGVGSIGLKVLKKLQDSEFEILIHDPFVDPSNLYGLKYQQVTLNQLFVLSDIISNHLPNNGQTQNLIDANLIYSMKKSVVFINTGRENQVDYNSLSKFMKKNKTATAILDVTKHEPILPWSSLLRRNNVYLTPNIAGAVYNEKFKIGDSIINKILDFKDGELV